MACDFFALGNIALDDLVFPDGTTRWCIPGGGAIYSALGMALWQNFAELVAPLGPDYPIDALGARLGFSGCRPVATTMRNWGLYEDDGTRQFLSRRAGGSWETLSPGPGDVAADATYAYCHLAPMPWPHLRPLIAALRRRGARTVSIDVQDRELRDVRRDELQELLHAVDVFLPSRQDTEVIAPGATAVAALQVLREHSPATAVIGVKCGAAGAIVHAAGASNYLAVPSCASRVVDQTGAGDAFCGGFLAGWALTGNLVDAALQATVSASYALAGVGPFALAAASMRDAEDRLARIRPLVRWRRFEAFGP